ncbi:hypothetical protein Tco_0308486 [Tanacetum coccineum]
MDNINWIPFALGQRLKKDDCIDLDGKERSILAKVKDLSVISELLKHMSSEGFDDVGLRYVGGRWVWLEFDSMDQVERMKDVFGSSGGLCHWNLGFQLVYRSWRDRWGASRVYQIWKGLSLDESLENEEHLDVDSCDSDSLKNVNNDSVSPSSRVLREEDVRGVESDLVDSFEKGEIRDDSVLYNDGCIKDCMEKNLEDDAGEILEVHSQGDCGNVNTDDNEDVTQVIAPEKDSIIAPPSTPPSNDLNIAVESGSWWIDYIGPLTSDEIDSDKRWSYRDPNGNIHGLFSLDIRGLKVVNAREDIKELLKTNFCHLILLVDLACLLSVIFPGFHADHMSSAEKQKLELKSLKNFLVTTSYSAYIYPQDVESKLLRRTKKDVKSAAPADDAKSRIQAARERFLARKGNK